MTATTDDAELKVRHRAMWASGDYSTMVETFLLPLGPELVAAAGVGSGQRVLDVAAGTGNASLPAARTGAAVTASDLTPELLDAGRQRAEAEGLELEWVQADAEHLPFADESFDVVMSCIGVMFAPHHQQAADELVRVCRPGGTLALLSWTPEGMLGALFRTMGEFAPPPPPGAQPPPFWGSEEHLARCSATASSCTRSSARRSRSPRSARARTTPSTSGPTTGPRSPCRRTRAGPAARPSSCRRWTASATTGTTARPTAPASTRSTCSRSAPGAELAQARARRRSVFIN